MIAHLSPSFFASIPQIDQSLDWIVLVMKIANKKTGNLTPEVSGFPY